MAGHRGLGRNVAVDGGYVAVPLRGLLACWISVAGRAGAGTGLDPSSGAGAVADLTVGRDRVVALVVAGIGGVSRPCRRDAVDEKTQGQALDGTPPLLPITFNKAEQRTHGYVRHGMTNLGTARTSWPS